MGNVSGSGNYSPVLNGDFMPYAKRKGDFPFGAYIYGSP